MLLNLLFGTCFLVFGVAELREAPVVELKQGKVNGHLKKSYTLTSYTAFEGIPYAKPALGNLRFKDPQPAEKWEGTLSADKQYNCPFAYGSEIIGTEDCLYMYVYVPREKINRTENLAVIVHIHGGGFVMCSPSMLAGPDYMMTHSNIIYVTFNYRLGILGFLCTEDSVSPGNMGLKDQTMALKWIQDNIKEFGGNPESVTITGLSAGGASVQYHYLSPMSKGLFARGFSQSGTALNAWALTKKPLEKAKFAAKKVGCETESTEKMVECFRSKPVKDLVVIVLDDNIPIVPFGPVVEVNSVNPFLPDNPYKMLKEGKVYDVPWINSNVIEEGLIPVGFYLIEGKIPKINENFDSMMLLSLDLYDVVDDSKKNITMEKIRKYYFGDKPLTEENYQPLVKAHTDREYIVDSELATRTQAKAMKSPVYYYLYGYLSHLNLDFGNRTLGVSHGADASLMFSWPDAPSKLVKEDEKMMLTLTDFLVKYATKGVPKIGGVPWKAVNSKREELNYMVINSPEQIKMSAINELAPTEFWDSLPIKENGHIY